MWCLFCKRDIFNVAISSSLGFLWCFKFVIPPGSQHYLLCPIMFVCWARCIHITSPIQRCVNAYWIYLPFWKMYQQFTTQDGKWAQPFLNMERCMRKNNNESFTRCSKQVLSILKHSWYMLWLWSMINIECSHYCLLDFFYCL